jgi:hypothetical protein
VSDYRLDYRGSISGRDKYFSSSLCVQTSSGAHRASCPMSTGIISPGVKLGRVVTLTTNILCWSEECVGAISFLPTSACLAIAGQIVTLHSHLLYYLEGTGSHTRHTSCTIQRARRVYATLFQSQNVSGCSSLSSSSYSIIRVGTSKLVPGFRSYIGLPVY